MKFSENQYYIEKYIKCDNCGMLIYGEGLKKSIGSKTLFCSEWCIEWAQKKCSGEDDPNIPLPRDGIHLIG